MQAPDYRKFVFTATGEGTSLDRLDLLDLCDNLNAEVERLESVAELLVCVKSDEMEPQRVLPGLALVLNDIRARMRAMIDLVLSLPK